MLSNQFIAEIKLKRDEVPSFDAYPFCLDAVRSLSSLVLHPAVTFIVGENGSGKSTLLEAIAVAWGFNPEGGTKNFSFGTYSSHSELHRYIRLSRGIKRPKDGFFLRAESFFNVATEIERLDEDPENSLHPSPPPIKSYYGGQSLHAQSHGESFMSLVLNRFGGNGLYILDEPEAALSPTRQMALLSRMQQLVNLNSQFVIATHSPIVMAYPNAVIYQLGPDGMDVVSYEDTEHYQMSKRFINDYKSSLDVLFAEV